MAGDWIKMRSDIYRDPKVSVIADTLMARDGDLARYVNQMCQRDMIVTRNVMRNVTVGALVSIWGVMRQRGKRCGDDLVCDGVTAAVLDDIADLPGIGAAMKAAGWVLEDGEGISFPNFFEGYNVDPSEKNASGNAARQRRYRERQAAEKATTSGIDGRNDGDVTRDVTVTHREEKRREEKTPPQPPKGGDGDSSGLIGFETFWSTWPRSTRKGGKGECLKVWSKANLESHTDAIVAHVKAMCRSKDWTKDEGAFIPAPAVYLRGRKWDGAELDLADASASEAGFI